MDKLNRMIVIGVMIMAAIALTIYVYLDSQHDSPSDSDPTMVDACRDLVRQGADILVQVARDNLQSDDPVDSVVLKDLRSKSLEIEAQMDDLGCLNNPESWAYGSFRQEMAEYTDYIDSLTRMHGNG